LILIFPEPRFLTPEHELNKRPMQMFWVDQQVLEQVAAGVEGVTAAESQDVVVMLTQVQTMEDDDESGGWPVRPTLETVGEFKTTPAIHAGYAATWFGLSGAGLVMTKKLMTRGRA
jgi:cytochrome oxidase assembly protein ShyY1